MSACHPHSSYPGNRFTSTAIDSSPADRIIPHLSALLPHRSFRTLSTSDATDAGNFPSGLSVHWLAHIADIPHFQDAWHNGTRQLCPVGAGAMNTNELPGDLIGLSQGAKLVGMCRQSLLRWIMQGKIVGWRTGWRWKVSKQDVLSLVERFGREEAAKKKQIDASSLPLTRREIQKRNEQTAAELKRIGIR